MKNKKMGILAVLVMLVAVTLNAVGGTYAKYISSVDLTDEARVAKWDFKLNGLTPYEAKDLDINLFKSSYELVEDTNKSDTYVVSNEPGVKVVAPGTAGQYEFDITGTAETNYTVTFDGKNGNPDANNKQDFITNNIVVKDETGAIVYDPIRFKLTINGVAIKNSDNKEWLSATEANTELKKDIQSNGNSIFGENVIYRANSSLNAKVKIEWAWNFGKYLDNTESIHNPTDYIVNDEYDTYLSQLQDKRVDFKANVKITQSDKQWTTGTLTPNNNVVVANSINKETIQMLSTTYKYDPKYTNEVSVVSNGSNYKLVGTIRKNNAIDEAYSSVPSDRTDGYYYAMYFDGNQAATLRTRVNGGQIKDVEYNGWTTAWQLFGLDKNSSTKKIEILNSDDSVKFTIDYSELKFAE